MAHFITSFSSRFAFNTTMKGSSVGSSASCGRVDLLPTIIIFDLDDCLWTPEMHELSGMPNLSVEGPLDPTNPNSSLGTVGMKVPSRRGGRKGYDWGNSDEIVELYPGARQALRELATNPKYQEIQVAVASTSLEPTYSQACIDGIEIVKGMTMRDMISYSQIGRSGKLSSRKTGHFRLIHEESGGIPYDEMLFFDDCNWADHVGDINKEFGVVGVRTGVGGLTIEHFHNGLDMFKLQKRNAIE